MFVDGEKEDTLRTALDKQLPAHSAPLGDTFLLLSEGFTLKGENRWQPPVDDSSRRGEPTVSPQLQVGRLEAICIAPARPQQCPVWNSALCGIAQKNSRSSSHIPCEQPESLPRGGA